MEQNIQLRSQGFSLEVIKFDGTCMLIMKSQKFTSISYRPGCTVTGILKFNFFVVQFVSRELSIM